MEEGVVSSAEGGVRRAGRLMHEVLAVDSFVKDGRAHIVPGPAYKEIVDWWWTILPLPLLSEVYSMISLYASPRTVWARPPLTKPSMPWSQDHQCSRAWQESPPDLHSTTKNTSLGHRLRSSTAAAFGNRMDDHVSMFAEQIFGCACQPNFRFCFRPGPFGTESYSRFAKPLYHIVGF